MNLAAISNRNGNPVKKCCLCLYSLGFTTGTIGRVVGLSPALPLKWIKQAGVFQSSRSPNPARACAACLYSIGYGLPKIERVTGLNRGAARKWLLRQRGYAPERAAARREANAELHHRRNRDARFALALSAFWPRCSVEKVTKTESWIVERRRRIVRAHYHANKRHIYQRSKDHLPTAMARRLRHRLWKVTKGKVRSARTLALVGCSSVELVAHLEGKFLQGMTWNNRSAWHIDHIKPCASFDLTQAEEQRRCFHFTNLQPLWAQDNRRKWKTWTP